MLKNIIIQFVSKFQELCARKLTKLSKNILVLNQTLQQQKPSSNFARKFKMKILVIVLFILTMLLGTLAISIIVKFLNNKSIIKSNVQDKIQVDLAVVTLVYVYLYSSMFIACEVFGPSSSVTALNIALWVLQCLFNMGFNCIIALEFIQFCNIFDLTLLNDWPDFRRLFLTRILVFSLGLIIGSGLCSVRTGSCRRTQIYNYFIEDAIKVDPDKPSMLSGVTWITYGIIILIFQISVEIKRFLLNRADEKVDNLAFLATKQLQDALSKFIIQTPLELKAINQQMSDTQHSRQGLFPRPFLNLKPTDVARGLTKTTLDIEEGPRFVDQQDQTFHTSSDDHSNENTLRDIEDGSTLSAAGNLEDNISVIEETSVQAVIQNLHNSGPYQEAYQAWEKNNKLDLDPTENNQMPSNSKSSRDQVECF